MGQWKGQRQLFIVSDCNYLPPTVPPVSLWGKKQKIPQKGFAAKLLI